MVMLQDCLVSQTAPFQCFLTNRYVSTAKDIICYDIVEFIEETQQSHLNEERMIE